MSKLLIAAMMAALAGLIGAPAQAQQCASGDTLCRAKSAVQDLGRIVAPDGVQETYTTPIGGIDQWLNVRGQDRNNPVILFVHGGPASPAMPTSWQFQRPIEEYFTVVHWDQRGAGKSFRTTDPASIADTIHIPRYIDDAIEVAEHVRKRYRKDKIILMGHSWGTIVGMGAALKRPDLFYAYVGVGQVINVRDNERISYDYALKAARDAGNAEALKDLASIAPYPGDQPITRERIITARKWPQFYGGLTAYRDASLYYYRAPLLSSEYDEADVKAIDEGNVYTLGKILPEYVDVDYKGVRQFPIPVLMFLGRHDYTTPAQPAIEWMGKVKAPYKRIVMFERSAHMVPWEEPGKVLVSLLDYVRPLAVKAKR
jgi:pimeloyl-ACP methyl ester carboxylesterase